jgi:hypothetical protein
MKSIFKLLSVSFFILIISLACSKSNDTTGSGGTTSQTVPAVYSKIYGATSITSDGTYITIKSNGTPDHKVFIFRLLIVCMKISAALLLEETHFQKTLILFQQKIIRLKFH